MELQVGTPRTSCSLPSRARVGGLCCALLAAAWATASAEETTGVAAAVIARLFDITAQPAAALDPQRRYLLLVHERKLLELEQLAAPVVSVAGRDINPATYGPHAPLDYFALTLVEIATGESTTVALPRDATIGFPAWAPDGSRFAFTLTKPAGTELWIGEPAEGRAYKLVDGLNASLGPPCTWMPDSERVLCRLIAPNATAHVPTQPRAVAPIPGEPPAGPGQPAILDAQVVRGLLESRLALIAVASGQRRTLGGIAAFESVDPAPSGAFLLITRVREPYPLVSGVDAFERSVEIWDAGGKFVMELQADVRAAHWQPAQPATLVFVAHSDGFDRVLLQAPPFTARPVEIYRTAERFGGLDWLAAGDTALVRDYSTSARVTRVWRVDARSPGTLPRQLQEGSIDAAPAALGTPVITQNRFGKPVVATHAESFYVRGEALGASGARPFLAHVSLQTGAVQRVWESTRSGYEEVVDLLSPDAEVLLTRHQSAAEPPNYLVSARTSSAVVALTDYRHPAPSLGDAVHMRLSYARADGYELAADLYLPPGVAPGATVPLVVWAYPRQVGATTGALATRSRERFLDHERAFKLVFLLHGYAVMDNVAMPIVGSGADANDTFIEQIVANAEAAISAAANTGLIDRSRVGVAGHSYGAFLAGNLLAHSRLFNAGVALSGAYNRTLTPFGFQTERRTFWEAPDTYLAMSPFLYSNRIAAPLLLVHGLQDKNAGTSPLQSTQFYQAIRGNGGRAELLLLPLEGHSYRARESVLRTATAMLDWFDRYL
jgi:dipeptidyl aminopeptidase/acylaminoacyl peptidase